ncbi:MAG: DUF4139 domain-containing protein [Gammaproteobacteria bacterium]
MTQRIQDRSRRAGRSLVTATVCATLAAAGSSLAADSDDTLTIYSSLQPGAVSPELYRPAAGRRPAGQVPGYAIVRHDRRYALDRGIHPLRVTDVAALIDPTTVSFSSLDEPETRVLEQGFQFDLVSQAKLFERYLGERITVEQVIGDHLKLLEGTLLSAADGLTLQLDDGSVQAVRSFGSIRFPDLPGGLITRPTLEWLLDSPASGPQQTRIAYKTRGMTWWADYNLVYGEQDGAQNGGCALDLSSWVSIINQSGASYDNARLKLIAGDVHRAEPKGMGRQVVARMAMAEEADVGFQEKSFFEYHLYTLGRRTDLPDNATRQIELFPTARGVPCEKELVFAPTLNYRNFGGYQLDPGYGSFGKGDVNFSLRFTNDEAVGLGVPLPAGRIRVSKEDPADGSLE